MTPAPNPLPAPIHRAAPAFCGVLALLVVFRLWVGFDPFPGWTGDPIIQPEPVISLTPFTSLASDALTLLAAACVVLSLARSRFSVGIITCSLFAVGLAVAAYHSAFARNNTLEHLLHASHWAAAIAASIGMFAAARERSLRGLCAGVLLSAVVMLAAKGVMQVFVEHAMTVRMFAEQKESLFAAQGWSTGSPMALAYERRLMQPEATGWLGMSNVLGTTAAASVVALAGLLFAGTPSTVRCRWAIGFGIAAATLCLALTHSKGGFVACVAGLFLLAAAAFWNRHERPIGPRKLLLYIGPLLTLSPLVLVVVRGVIGERLGELSLLFRSFYLEAAARIITLHPWIGVGPAGFKDAYILAKNPLSPEEVALPHSLFIDLTSTLGVGGLAWSIIVLWFLSRIGRVLFARASLATPATTNAPPDTPTKPLFLILAGATIAAAWVERPIASPDVMAVRLLGLFAGLWVASGVASMVINGRARPVALAMAAAAVAAALHAQIELTGTHIGSAPWLLALVGLAAGCWEPAKQPPKAALSARLFPALATLAAAGIAFQTLSVRTWQNHLADAADALVEVPTLNARLEGLRARAPQPGDSIDRFAEDLKVLTGTTVDASPESLEKRFREYSVDRLSAAFGSLEKAMAARNDHFPTLRAFTKLGLQFSTLTGSRAVAEDAIVNAEGFAMGHPSAQSHSWLALLNRTAADLFQDPSRLRASQDSLRQAIALAPFDLQYALMLADLESTSGNIAAAQDAARKALELNALTRLDPIKSLTPDQKARMERLAQ